MLRVRKVSYLRDEVLAAVLLRIQVIWYVRPCRLVKTYLLFERRNAFIISQAVQQVCLISCPRKRRRYVPEDLKPRTQTCCVTRMSFDMKDGEEGYWTSGFRIWGTQSQLQRTGTKKTKA
jgi:hypothetical protein